MAVQLKRSELSNAQQMEVAVHGPDGATHLILCTGVAILGPAGHETYTFFVGPQLSRRQFVGVIASGALSHIQACAQMFTKEQAKTEQGFTLVLIEAEFDDETGQVRVKAEVSSGTMMTKIAISYNVSILAELPT